MECKRYIKQNNGVEKYCPDLILMQETHLRPTHNISIPNYTCYRNNRITDGNARGCTLILIKRNVPHFNLPTPALQHIEATIVALTSPNLNPISIISVYVSPSSDERLFTLDFEHLLQTNSNFVILTLHTMSGTAQLIPFVESI
ncbi:hypothetical protein TNCV_2487971 [Trichonephila clavipes]|uniref:Endonuclease/exonuclease/phosphatase domain-containing protein n=1 Tax=Trichonephila clavipes TaxID=2585209 RepID=A0A8X6W0B0_TRICX|nr:hypothetical protein TNCV_2487971 [Trichonephila clavipes]